MNFPSDGTERIVTADRGGQIDADRIFMVRTAGRSGQDGADRDIHRLHRFPTQAFFLSES